MGAALPIAMMLVTLAAPVPVAWQPWSLQVFEQAQREHKLVLLDLGAVWCHWCHVMDEKTYADAEVQALIGQGFIAVRVDQDSVPDLAQRYELYGWPATIIFAADGSEIVKKRGYIPPQRFRDLLAAVIADPSSVVELEPELLGKGGTRLDPEQVAELDARFYDNFDARFAGWGQGQKYLHAPSLELALRRAAAGDDRARRMLQRTLDANQALIDAIEGGVFQYSDARNEQAPWSTPHFEKIMSFQADDLRLYSASWAATGRASDKQAAERIARYLLDVMHSPEGGFYTSQDADVSARVSGDRYYRASAAARKKLGAPPIDRHLYARETGWAVRALAVYARVFLDGRARAAAIRGAEWAIAERQMSDGGYRHGEHGGAEQLGDSLAMAEATLELYALTGERRWLDEARSAATAIEARFRDPRAGFWTTPVPKGAPGVFAQPVLQLDENIAATRLFHRLARASGEARWSALSDHGARHLSEAIDKTQRSFLSGILLADEERGAGLSAHK